MSLLKTITNMCLIHDQSRKEQRLETLPRFLTIAWDQLAKIRQHSWKERLKISIVAKFESDFVKTNQDMAPQSRRILQTLVWWGWGAS